MQQFTVQQVFNRVRQAASLRRAGKAVMNLGMLALWAWLYHPVFQYLAVLFSREEFRTNQIVLAAVSCLLLYRAWRSRVRPRLDIGPHLFWPGLALALTGSLAYLAAERWLDINTLSAFLFGVASYGLLGLWLDPLRWRQGLPAMLLVVGVLPFGEHMETFAGYPLRKFTAVLVRGWLGSLGFSTVGVDTILVFESGISQVDIPCSGVKSLWTGALFLLAATWIENRRLGLRWLITAGAMAALLFSSNLLRVALLALTGPALGWTLLARMIHLPLGVLGFTGSCAAALVLLHRLPVCSAEVSEAELSRGNHDLPRPAWLLPLVGLSVLLMALGYTPNAASQSVAAAAPPRWSFTGDLVAKPAPLSEVELEQIRQDGAETADRFSFDWQGEGGTLRGAVMLMTSQTWRGQHRPERCFEVFGLTVQESFTYLVSTNFPLRFLTLSGSGGTERAAAVYWLQSASRTTEDFGQRIWADLEPGRERWVLVTVLLDREVEANAPELAGLFNALHASVERSLMEGELP